jgi:hypothetical protein
MYSLKTLTFVSLVLVVIATAGTAQLLLTGNTAEQQVEIVTTLHAPGDPATAASCRECSTHLDR